MAWGERELIYTWPTECWICGGKPGSDKCSYCGYPICATCSGCGPDHTAWRWLSILMSIADYVRLSKRTEKGEIDVEMIERAIRLCKRLPRDSSDLLKAIERLNDRD